MKNENAIADGLENVMSGLGTDSDKGSYATFTYKPSTLPELSAMFATSAMNRKIVSILPGDMTREWRTFEDTELTPEQIKQYEAEEKRLALKKVVREAMTWARLYGGAFIVPLIDNGDTDLSLPIDFKKLKKGQLKGFTVVDARYCNPAATIDQNPMSANFLLPTHYSLTGALNSMVHHSRLIRFDGLLLPREEFQNNRFWHQSVLDAVRQELLNATTVANSIAALMHELNLDIINVKGLSSSLAAGQEAAIKRRFETYTLVKSMFHTAILDEDETFSNRVMPASGIDGLIDKFYGLLAAAIDVPATRFLGNSPGGLNATGESDMRNYYDNIKDKQSTDLSPRLRVLDNIIALSLWGSIPEEIHEYTWVSLWQESDAEKAARELTDAQRDQIYLQNGVVTEAIVAGELMQNRVYSNIDKSYVDELENALEELNLEELPNGQATLSTTTPEREIKPSEEATEE